MSAPTATRGMQSEYKARESAVAAVPVIALAAVAVTGLALPSAEAATPSSAYKASASPAKSPAGYTRTKYAYSEGDSGVSLDPGVPHQPTKLGVKWAVPDQGASEASPVVAYSAHLGTDVVYQGNLDGDFTAFSAKTGATLWSDSLGTSVIASPLVVDGAVWVARTFDPVLYKINAGTGVVECQTNPMPSLIYSTPTMATPPGGIPTVFVGRESTTGSDNGFVYAITPATARTYGASAASTARRAPGIPTLTESMPRARAFSSLEPTTRTRRCTPWMPTQARGGPTRRWAGQAARRRRHRRLDHGPGRQRVRRRAVYAPTTAGIRSL